MVRVGVRGIGETAQAGLRPARTSSPRSLPGFGFKSQDCGQPAPQLSCGKLTDVGGQRLERLIERASGNVATGDLRYKARGPLNFAVMNGGFSGESAYIFRRVILDRHPARIPAVVEDAAQQFWQLSREMSSNRHLQPIPQHMHPGSDDAIREPPVVGTEFGSHLGEPGGGLFDTIIEIADSCS